MKPRELQDLELCGVAGGKGRVGAKQNAVLLVGFDALTLDCFVGRFAARAQIVVAEDYEAGLHSLAARPFDVLCLGEGLSSHSARRFLDQARAQEPAPSRRHVVLAAGADLNVFQDLVDQDELFYLTARPPALVDLESILESALAFPRNMPQQLPGETEKSAGWRLMTQTTLELLQRLAAETRVESVVAEVAAETARLVEADAAECLVFDSEHDTLWRPGRDTDSAEGTEPESAVAGLVGFVARTGRSVCLHQAGADPRYDATSDNPAGDPEDRLLVVPVSVEGEVLALILARRVVGRQPFETSDQLRVQHLAQSLRPTFSQLALVTRLKAAATASDVTFFRAEALTHHLQGGSDSGRPLEISPSWSRWVFHLLIAFAVFVLGFSLFGSIHEYASGPAVVVLGERIDVISKVTGAVTSLVVKVGARVEAGDLVARLYSAQEAAELDRIRQEFELALVQRLRAPGDSTVERALSSLRAQKELAEARLEERSLRAPVAGVVSDLRARPGQLLSPGQVVLTLGGEERAAPGIVALLPGRFRPLLKVGMELRFELDGYGQTPHFLRIEELGENVLGPDEARRFLGSDFGHAVPITEPVTWVRGTLPEASFMSDGREVKLYDGIQGQAELQVRSESILSAMIPGLKGFFGGGS